MRVLVTGGRDFHNWQVVHKALDEVRPNVVIHGSATGADQSARGWAQLNGVPEIPFPAFWYANGTIDRTAGPKRNARMLKEGKPDLVLAFPGGLGTAHMVKLATAKGIPVKRIWV